jgi:hypothetical protein
MVGGYRDRLQGKLNSRKMIMTLPSVWDLTSIRSWLLVIVGFVAVLCLPAQAATLAVWSEAVGDHLSVRAIATDSCPTLTIDAKSRQMALRALPNPAFPLATCMAILPDTAQKIEIDGKPVAAWHSSIDRIVVLGDTGCRLKGKIIQDCNDPVAWPFAEVARSAAAERPDLVIHVGDYYYRESACPAGRDGCKDSPHGDAWSSWAADFFEPAAPLLAAAPWVFVRGNHEQCGRGAEGWFRFLDAGETPLTCPATSAAFSVPIGGITLNIVDSADTSDEAAAPEKVALFHAQLESVSSELAKGPGWILTHRPIWGFSPPDKGEIGERDELPVNRTEQAAVSNIDLSGIGLILSGHVHLFAASSAGAQRPAQLIVGNGGDLRDGTLPGFQAHSVMVAGLETNSFVVEQFGYLVLERSGSAWNGILKHADGSVIAHCRLDGRVLGCSSKE